MSEPTHEQGMLFMECYKLWDTPADGRAWQWFRGLRQQSGFRDYERFSERVPPESEEYVLFDRLCCSFEQAGVLMKHGLMHPDLFFDAWASPTSVWAEVEPVVQGLRADRGFAEIYANFEWLAKRGETWYAEHAHKANLAAAAGEP